MNRSITMTVNGVSHTREVEPRLLLVHFLRDTLGLTGTHLGCDTSQCGACTVAVDGEIAKSCTLFAVQADGASVTTIEGLAKDERLHPIQTGFWEEHGAQCGFCTPGMIMAAWGLLKRTSDPSEAEIREGIGGNICRCTGYEHIVNAIQHAARIHQRADYGVEGDRSADAVRDVAPYAVDPTAAPTRGASAAAEAGGRS